MLYKCFDFYIARNGGLYIERVVVDDIRVFVGERRMLSVE